MQNLRSRKVATAYHGMDAWLNLGNRVAQQSQVGSRVLLSVQPFSVRAGGVYRHVEGG